MAKQRQKISSADKIYLQKQRRKFLLPPYDTFSWGYEQGNCILKKDSQDGTEERRGGTRDVDMSNDDEYNIYNIATMIQVQRGWDDVIIPVFDMLSHRNGEQYLNTKNTPVHWSENVTVKSSRMILQGEEIYTSYNLCRDCQGRYYG